MRKYYFLWKILCGKERKGKFLVYFSYSFISIPYFLSGFFPKHFLLQDINKYSIGFRVV